MADPSPLSFDNTIKILGIVGAIGTFLFGVVQWSANQKAQLDQREIESVRLSEQRNQENIRRDDENKKNSEQRRIEAQKPFLDRQLTLYSEIVIITSFLSVSKTGAPEWLEHKEKFERLYWGELAMVENRGVEGAMVKFRDALLKWTESSEPQKILQPLSLSLAQEIRKSLDESWGIKVWTSNR